MILDIGIGGAARSQEGTDPAWCRCRRAAAGQEPLQPDGQHAVPFQQLVLRQARRAAMFYMNLQMVMQILANAGKVLAHPYAMGAQLCGWSDPRQHQDLW